MVTWYGGNTYTADRTDQWGLVGWRMPILQKCTDRKQERYRPRPLFMNTWGSFNQYAEKNYGGLPRTNDKAIGSIKRYRHSSNDQTLSHCRKHWRNNNGISEKRQWTNLSLKDGNCTTAKGLDIRNHSQTTKKTRVVRPPKWPNEKSRSQ